MKNKISFTEIIKWILAVIIVVAVACVGVVFHVNGWYHELTFYIIMIVLTVGLIVGTIVSFVMNKKFLGSVDRENLQNELLKKREQATEISQNLIYVLKKIIRTIDFCRVVVLVSVCIINFCLFSVAGIAVSGAALAFIIGTYAGLGFIRPRKLRIDEKKQENYLSESEYPIIYATARRAAEKIGCKGRIKIFVEHNFSVGIVGLHDGYAITIGTYVLDVMSQEELYNILLHEFAHMVEKNKDINEIMTYASQLEENNSLFSILPYLYLHAKFNFEFFTYQYVCSLMNEDAADVGMRDNGDPEIAASMLIKLKFFELYDWEQGTYDDISIFESETVADDLLRRNIRSFNERMAIRSDEWIRLIDGEIISRNATHSTIKMRIDSLGVTDLKVLPKCDSQEYLSETEKAILMIECAVKKDLEKTYRVVRKNNYLDNKELLDGWEENGKAITKFNYQGILLALLNSGRNTDFVNTCCQTIEEIPEPANYFAHHMYGIYLLRCYDEKGIDHLYKSIELNHNNWFEAMEHIGRYACVVGKQDQLDNYREKALQLAKKQENVYEKMNTLNPKDVIVPEVLPNGMLEGFLRFVRDLDRGRFVIDEIYIVRKIISRDTFVSCVIVLPVKNANANDLAFVMENIYQFLDKASDWPFSLFDMRFIAGALYGKIKKARVYKRIIY